MSTKKAVILHGTDGKPDSNWFPWLKSELESRGYEVWVPFLPNNHIPNRQTYNDFLLGSDWDFTDNLVIGHSSGAVSVLNLVLDERCPAIKTGVLVGAWEDTSSTPLDPENFAHLFPEGGFDFSLIKEKAPQLLFLHGDNDPYCPLQQAQHLAKKLASEIVIVPQGGHLGNAYPQLPVLLDSLSAKNWL